MIAKTCNLMKGGKEERRKEKLVNDYKK